MGETNVPSVAHVGYDISPLSILTANKPIRNPFYFWHKVFQMKSSIFISVNKILSGNSTNYVHVFTSQNIYFRAYQQWGEFVEGKEGGGAGGS